MVNGSNKFTYIPCCPVAIVSAKQQHPFILQQQTKAPTSTRINNNAGNINTIKRSSRLFTVLSEEGRYKH